jgi:hypothetical protein
MSSVSPLLVCVFFVLGSGHCYYLLLFATFGLVNVPGSCNVGSNDAYLSDSPYGCSGPSFSQSVKQKTNDVLPVFFFRNRKLRHFVVLMFPRKRIQ